MVTQHLKYIDLSLSRIKDFLNKIDNPQNKIKNIIHVAGTNGKGSTTAFLRYILQEHGFSVNVFTSPHLVNYNERFRLKGQLITPDNLQQEIAQLQAIEGFADLSMFEATMVIGYVLFAKHEADYTILETGLGGRLDATNIVQNPILNIFSSISYDHENFLGDTLDKIAYEKFGILKNNTIVVSDYQEEIVIKVLRKQLKKYQIKSLFIGGIDYNIMANKLNITNNSAYNDNFNEAVLEQINLDKITLQGQHQKNNAALAIMALASLDNLKLNADKVNLALEKTMWFGRQQKVANLYDVTLQPNDILLLDGAHNIAGAKTLVEIINKYYNSDYQVYFMFSLLQKKKLLEFLTVFQNKPVTIVPMQQEDHESYSIKEITLACRQLNIPCLHVEENSKYNVAKNLKLIAQKDGKKLIIIGGSLYLVGKILKDNNIYPQ